MNRMNKVRLFILFALFITAFSWYSYYHLTSVHNDIIVESNDITSSQNYLTSSDSAEKTVVVFDIDNTIGAPPTDLGSDQWFYQNVQRLQQSGKSTQDAIDAILPISLQILEQTPLIPSQPETVAFIRTLQEKGFIVIALTARSIDKVERTLKQLQEVGIDFSLKLAYKFPIVYEAEKSSPAIYVGGVIFVGDHDKGEVLAHWLTQTGIEPSKIIFIDDKMKNIKSVEKALCKRHYPFIGIRYSRFDTRVKNFNLLETDKELEQFLRAHPEARPIPIT